MKVLLLAHTFAPYNAIGAIRATKLAEHLLASGHDVRVITGAPLPYPGTLAASFPAERVLATRWRRVEAPLDMLRARIGDRVRQESAPGPAGAGTLVPGRRSLAERGVRAYRNLISIPDAQAGWIPYAVAAGKKLFTGWRPDLVYSSALPFSSHIVASRLARMAGCPWVGEYRDLYSGHPFGGPWQLRERLNIALEQRVMRTASAIVSVSPRMTDYLAALHGKPAVTIMNGFDPADFDRAPLPVARTDPHKTSIVYTGSIYAGRYDPGPLLEALRRLGEAGQHFELRFFGDLVETVRPMAEARGVGHLVETHRPVPYLTALGLQKAADILLLLLWDNPAGKAVVTGKVFEYAGSGRPILSIGCEDGAAATLVRERGLGLASSDPAEIAAFLSKMAGMKRATGRTCRDGAETAAAGLSRREQFLELEAFLDRHGLLVPAKGCQVLPGDRTA
jgi:glycosyltransferase involved in cell wall biosynthesis